MNFNAYSPKQWKISLIFCLLHRAYSICSSASLFTAEVCTLCNMFLSNGYPKKLFNSVYRRFMARLNSPNPAAQDTVDANSCVYLIIPFFGKVSEIMKNRLRLLCNRYQLNAKVVFKPFKVANYFSLKSRCPKPLKSMVVYQFTCSVDQNISYIGRTKRHLLSRVKEHSCPTGNSAVLEHIAVCNCSCTVDNFTILTTCCSALELSIMEALFIRDLKPSLNASLNNQGQSIFLKL